MKLKHAARALCAATTLAALPAAHAQDVIRHTAPGGHAPFSVAVEVPTGATTVYLSGMGAPPLDPSSKDKSIAAYGDTATQTTNALKRIQTALAGIGLTLGDVVQMHVFLADDPKLKTMDFAGMNKAYGQFFGTPTQPNLPVRAAFGVAHLANPGWLVEIEVTVVRKAAK